MATTGRVRGKDLRLWEGATPTAVGSATNCTFSVSAGTLSARDKDTSGLFTDKVVDSVEGTLSTEAFILESDASLATLGAAVIAGTSFAFEFTTDVSGDHVWSGTCVITSYEENAPVDGYATYSVTMETSGTITLGTVT